MKMHANSHTDAHACKQRNKNRLKKESRQPNRQSKKAKILLTLLLLHLAHPFLDFVFLFLPPASTKLFKPGSGPFSTDAANADDANRGMSLAPVLNVLHVLANSAVLFLIE
jgi:hypothetical protein